MIVTAKCVAKCWDSERCIMYLPGEMVEIDSEGKLADLTTAPLDPRNQPRKVAYVFEFDRVAARAKAQRAAEVPNENG